jgi:hypothetical protein
MVRDDIARLQSLARESRTYHEGFQKKFPVRFAGLKLVNNNTIREWSYKGVTLVSRQGANGKKLEPILRTPHAALSLPPTYRTAPDFRDKRARTASRNFREPIQEIVDMCKRPWTSVHRAQIDIHGPDQASSDTLSSGPHIESSNNTGHAHSTMPFDFQEVHYTQADKYFRMHILATAVTP